MGLELTLLSGKSYVLGSSAKFSTFYLILGVKWVLIITPAYANCVRRLANISIGSKRLLPPTPMLRNWSVYNIDGEA